MVQQRAFHELQPVRNGCKAERRAQINKFLQRILGALQISHLRLVGGEVTVRPGQARAFVENHLRVAYGLGITARREMRQAYADMHVESERIER